jgi:lipoic acid synthetase
VRLLTLGQYLQPSPAHLPVARFAPPAEFDAWAERARGLGFDDVAAGPLVRSSYHADRLAGADR